MVESKTKQEQTTLQIGVYMVFFSETALLNKRKTMYKWLERSLWDPTLHKKTLFSNWCWYLHLLSVSWALLSVSWFILRVQPSLSKYTIHYLQTNVFGMYYIWRKLIFKKLAWIWISAFLNAPILKHKAWHLAMYFIKMKPHSAKNTKTNTQPNVIS